MNGMMVAVVMRACRTGGAEHTEPLVPEAHEDQGAEGPFTNAEEPAGALVPEHGIKPPDERAVADERHETFRLIGPLRFSVALMSVFMVAVLLAIVMGGAS
jgi:hypothetical protein